MPRRPRIVLPGIPLHLIQRSNNRQACFFADEDYRAHLGWLETYAREVHCTVHAYVVMTNHVHLLVTPHTASAAGELMKRVGQHYVQYINRAYRRSGTLWEGRFRPCLIQGWLTRFAAGQMAASPLGVHNSRSRLLLSWAGA